MLREILIIMNKCPNSETLLYYIEGYFSKERVKHIKKHLAVCDICRAVAKDVIEIKKKVETEVGRYGKTPLFFIPLHLLPIILN